MSASPPKADIPGPHVMLTLGPGFLKTREGLPPRAGLANPTMVGGAPDAGALPDARRRWPRCTRRNKASQVPPPGTYPQGLMLGNAYLRGVSRMEVHQLRGWVEVADKTTIVALTVA